MIDKIQKVERRFEEVQHQLQNPSVAQDQKKYRSLMKEFGELEPVVRAYRVLVQIKKELIENQSLLKDADLELREMAKEELKVLTQRQSEVEQELQLLLLPKDPNDGKNIILELRAGAGGDEASLFGAELFRAYSHFAQDQGWQVEILSTSDGNVGGYKEIIARIAGDKVYSKLKYESGVHRVQRVPETETQGRVHTSTITVAVIPEQETDEVKINMNEVRIDVTRSQGAGGQSVNRTESAVRVTHEPTGIIVFCQEGKSQLANRERAFQILYSKLVQLDEEKRLKEASDARLSQIGTGDRSERIRTYNFPQSRITDHRIGFTTHAISDIMSGKLNIVIEPLTVHYQTEAMKHESES